MPRPRLDAALVRSDAFQRRADLAAPAPEHLALPERAVQFGTGALLRGLVDDLVDAANRAGTFGGRIVAIGSTGSGRDRAINEQDGLYTLVVQGLEGGRPKCELRVVSAVSRAISAADEWAAVLACARDPRLEVIFSNTTEVGIRMEEENPPSDSAPRSFPAKLARFLHERAQTFAYDATRGVVVVPCELIEDNGDRLKELVLAHAARWALEPAFARWVEACVPFCNTLVDRIVPGAPKGDDAASLEATLAYEDALVTTCEPYSLLAIEGNDALRARLRFAEGAPGVIVTPSVAPYRERKVRLLNGAHTILVPIALLVGCATVCEAVEHELVGRFLRRAMLDELVPSLDAPGAEAFAHEVLERFANPHIQHQLVDITLHGTTKMRVRVVPSVLAAGRAGRAPASLAFGFAAYLAFMRGEVHARRRAAGLAVPDDTQGERVRALWSGVAPDDEAALRALAAAACADTELWGTDLASVPGFAERVAEALVAIGRDGPAAALEAHLAAGAAASLTTPPEAR